MLLKIACDLCVSPFFSLDPFMLENSNIWSDYSRTNPTLNNFVTTAVLCIMQMLVLGKQVFLVFEHFINFTLTKCVFSKVSVFFFDLTKVVLDV